MGNLRSTLKKVIKHFMTNKRVMVQCRTLINRDAVKRTSIDGVEHIIVSSATLPDDIVMNGGLYPADEIAKGFETLELTLAPVEHPTDSDGNFISASDPRAIHGFHAGAFNMNVHREDGRVHIDKYINVAEALKTDRGKRLLDRIDELETNDKARPIHTSVGVFTTSKSGRKIPGGIRGDTDSYSGRPLIVKNHAKVYFSSASIGLLEYSSPSKLKETFRSLGAPAMMLSSGALLTFKSPYNRGGYCLTKGEISRDQSVSFVHQLMISAELANKQLLGLTPTGPVLLKSNKKGQYEFCYRPRLNNLFSLISYIGKSNSGHVFVAKDRGHKKHLVIHQMRPTK